MFAVGYHWGGTCTGTIIAKQLIYSYLWSWSNFFVHHNLKSCGLHRVHLSPLDSTEVWVMGLIIALNLSEGKCMNFLHMNNFLDTAFNPLWWLGWMAHVAWGRKFIWEAMVVSNAGAHLNKSCWTPLMSERTASWDCQWGLDYDSSYPRVDVCLWTDKSPLGSTDCIGDISIECDGIRLAQTLTSALET